MFAEERRRQLLAYVQERGSASVTELSRLLGVSPMTVRRDVAVLAARGLVRRVRGGVMAVGSVGSRHEAAEEVCAICGMPATGSQRAVAVHPGGSQRAFCCPHCALVWQQVADAGEAVVLVRDLLYGRPVDARVATYVVGSDVVMCCQPSVVAFGRREDAERFVRGFGGQVLDWRGALTRLLPGDSPGARQSSPAQEGGDG